MDRPAYGVGAASAEKRKARMATAERQGGYMANVASRHRRSSNFVVRSQLRQNAGPG